MFAGVATITLNEDNSQVTGLLSKEGEEVLLIAYILFPGINENKFMWNIYHELWIIKLNGGHRKNTKWQIIYNHVGFQKFVYVQCCSSNGW